MTEQRRTASPLVFVAFGLGLLGLVLCVVPWTSASSRNEFVGEGSNSISQLGPRSRSAPPEVTSGPAGPAAPGHGVLAPPAKAHGVPPALRNPFNTNFSGGDSMDWTHMPGFAPQAFGVLVGDVTGLYPGHQIDLPVTFVNPRSSAIFVDTAKVTASGSVQCGSMHLLLSDITFATPVRVSAKSSITEQIPFGLLSSAPDACQGAAFTVTVTAKATSA